MSKVSAVVAPLIKQEVVSVHRTIPTAPQDVVEIPTAQAALEEIPTATVAHLVA